MDIYSTEGNKLEDFHKVIWDQVSDEARMIRQQKGYPRGKKKKKKRKRNGVGLGDMIYFGQTV